MSENIPCKDCICFPICLLQVKVELNAKLISSTEVERKWSVTALHSMLNRCEFFKEAINTKNDYLVPIAILFHKFKRMDNK